MVDENMGNVGAYRTGNHQAEIDRLSGKLVSTEAEVDSLKKKLAGRRIHVFSVVMSFLLTLGFSCATIYASARPSTHVVGSAPTEVDYHGMPAFIIFTIIAWVSTGLLIWWYKK